MSQLHDAMKNACRTVLKLKIFTNASVLAVAIKKKQNEAMLYISPLLEFSGWVQFTKFVGEGLKSEKKIPTIFMREFGNFNG